MSQHWTLVGAKYWLWLTRVGREAFELCQWSKEIEENNRMGKTRDLLKKIRDTKQIFHAKMGWIKDRNSTGLKEAEDIKKRWQKYTEELYNKDIHDPENHDGVTIHLESDILECELKWALGSITTKKASGGDIIPVELFQIPKVMLWKSCTQHAKNIGKFTSGHRTGKCQFSLQSQRKTNKSWKICMQVRKQQLELEIEQQTGSK